MAVWRYNTAAPDLSSYATNASLTQVADNLAAYVAEQNAAQSGGTTLIESFTGADGAPLPATFTQDGQNGLGIYQNALAVLAPFVPNTGHQYWYRSVTPMSTDDVSVVVQFLGYPKSSVPTTFYLRGSSSGLGNVYCRVLGTSVEIGQGAWSGTTFTRTSVWRTQSYTFGSNPSVELRTSGTNYYVYINGSTTPTISYTDGSGYPIDSAHRHVGGIMEDSNGLFFGTVSTSLTSFNASDVAVPATLGAGWELCRTSTGSVSKANGEGLLPANTFDNIVRASNVDTSLALSTGQIGILKPGWYDMTLRIHMNAGAGSNNIAACLFGHRSGGTSAKLKSGGDVQQVASCAATFGMYLEAGGYVQAAMNNGTGLAKGLIGDTGGTILYFSGILSNRVQ